MPGDDIERVGCAEPYGEILTPEAKGSHHKFICKAMTQMRFLF